MVNQNPIYSTPSVSSVKKEAQVCDPSMEYRAIAKHWQIIDVLVGGTSAIREVGELFLPRFPRERDETYFARLNQSDLPPYFKRIVGMISGMVLRKEIELEVSEVVDDQCDDIDLLGNNLSIFSVNILGDSLSYGFGGVLVEMPKGDENIKTKAQEKAANRRPYWKYFHAKDILEVRSMIQGGKRILSRVRLRECETVDDGEWGEKVIERIRVLYPGSWELWEKNKGGEWEIAIGEDGKPMKDSTSLDIIPFGFLDLRDIDKPPLLDIGYMNIKYYQNQSDYDWNLHLAVPLLFLFGFRDKEITASSNEAIDGGDVQSRAEFLEPTGSTYEYRIKRLENIETQINSLALAAILGQKLSAETAESKKIDRSQGDTGLHRIAQKLEDVLDNCLMFHSQYLGETMEGSCHVNRDFMDIGLEPAQIDAITKVRAGGYIRTETLLKILMNGNVFEGIEDFDPEVEAMLVEEAIPRPAELGTMPTDAQPIDEQPADQVSLDGAIS